MSSSRTWFRSIGVCLSAAVVFCFNADHAAVADELERLRTSSVDPADVVPVAPWDADSPQTLVRISNRLYQQDSGFFYPVDETTITVGLPDTIHDWDELVRRAKVIDATSFAALDELRPVRVSRLGAIDLEAPHGEPDSWCALIHQSGLVRYAEVNTIGEWTIVPNDSSFSTQWALNNTGQSGGTVDADIDGPEAWDITTGNPSVIVGVLDSGTFVDHEDLVANVWFNDDEVPGNSIDDDNNGYVDDFEGWDFGNNNNDPRSNNFHGTHVTGVINAATNNGIGISGLAGGFGGPGAKAMALGVGEGGPIGSVLDDAIIYATDNGATVITMSLSVGSSTAINDALDYAYNQNDVFVDCAAGNNGASVSYPANRPEVVAVGSTDRFDNRSSFSNPGPQVEVSAPGSSILSTQLGNSYGTSSGTSFAAPYVAALASLVRGLNPGLPAPEVRQLLIDTAEDVESPGFDNLTGWGRINAFAAVSQTATSDASVRIDRDRYSCSDSIAITLTDIDLAGSLTFDVALKSDVEPGGELVTLTEIGSGSGVFQGTVDTDAGAAVLDGKLQVVHADTVVAEYVDADNGAGGINVLKATTAITDCQPPLISNIQVVSIDDTGATVSWTTDEPGTSTVRYGEFAPTTTSSNGGLTTSHAVVIDNLLSCTSYRFEVESSDDLGNGDVDDNGGLLFTFETFGDFGNGVTPCHQGQASFDKTTYGCSDTVQIAITDIDLDTDPGSTQSIQVLLTSSSEPDGEWVTLTEAGTESNLFEGSIQLGGTNTVDGSLASAPDDLITVTYFDGDDGDGSTRIETLTARADCKAPEIQNLRVTALTATRAAIEWSTDEPATSQVDFGPTAGLGSQATDSTLKTAHQIIISAFEACDRAFFRVTSADANGDLRTADATGVPFEFNLSQVGGLVFHDNFELNDGWILGGEWERAVPQGIGSSNADPGVAYSGGFVIGNDLTGQGAFPGDYEPTAKDWAVTPPLATTSDSNLELIVQRKLGVTSTDSALIAIFNPNESIVWQSSGSVNDSDWVEQRFDISAEADGQASVRVGFKIESDDPGQSFGWNLDEVIIKDATQPDYIACGGCLGTPSFAGLVTLEDGSACDAGGVQLTWQAAAAWGSGTSGTYEVYRDTSPGFTPSVANRIAAGITTTSYVDDTAPIDTPVWYAVRARSDESCTGGVGLEDGNQTLLSVTDTSTQPLPGSVADGLRVDLVGQAHVRLSWNAVPGADSYVIRRATGAFVGLLDVGTTTATFFEDVDAAKDGNLYSYEVFAVNSCGQLEP